MTVKHSLVEIIGELKRGRLSAVSRATLLAYLERRVKIADKRAKALDQRLHDISDRVRGVIREQTERLLIERPGIDQRAAAQIVRRRAWLALNADLARDQKQRPKPCERVVRQEIGRYFKKSDTFGSVSTATHRYAGITATTT